MTSCTPARFRVLGEGELLGWGLALSDRIIIDLPEVELRGSFHSTDSLYTMLGWVGEIEVVWVDPEPTSGAG